MTRLLLVGGSTRMPMVVDMLRNLSGMEPDHTVHPDEAVARGAALYAAYLLAKESGDEDRASFTITNVNSHSLGVEGIDPETLRKRNVVLIPRNTPLPAKFTERFVTRSGEPAVDRVAGARRRERPAGRVHGHRADRDPRPARRAAEELAGRRHLRVRLQRPADGQRDWCRARTKGPRSTWSGPWGCPTTASPAGSSRSARRRASTSSRRWSRTCWQLSAGGRNWGGRIQALGRQLNCRPRRARRNRGQRPQ